MNIKYIFTKRDLEEFENEDLELKKKYDNYGIKIYKVIYKYTIQKNKKILEKIAKINNNKEYKRKVDLRVK